MNISDIERILKQIADECDDDRELLLDADKLEEDAGVPHVKNRDVLYEVEIIKRNNDFDIADRYIQGNAVRINIPGINKAHYINVTILKKLVWNFAVSARPKPGTNNRYMMIMKINIQTLLKYARPNG